MEDYDRYERGQSSDQAIFQAFVSALPLNSRLSEFDFWEGWKLLLGKETSASLVLKELSLHHEIWLLSNTNPRHIRKELERKVSFLERISGAIYSFEVGYRKPEPGIFEEALKQSGATPEKSLFIDDLENNIHAARKLGFHTIHYTGVKSLMVGLGALGLQQINPDEATWIYG